MEALGDAEVYWRTIVSYTLQICSMEERHVKNNCWNKPGHLEFATSPAEDVANLWERCSTQMKQKLNILVLQNGMQHKKTRTAHHPWKQCDPTMWNMLWGHFYSAVTEKLVTINVKCDGTKCKMMVKENHVISHLSVVSIALKWK